MSTRRGGADGGETRRSLPRRRPDQLPPGRHGLSADEVAESQRTRILAAMIEAAGRHGYHTASIADVTTHAGVSRKAFYERFEDKEQCFIAAYERALDRILALVREAFDTQDEWPDQVRAGLSALLHALAHDPAVARVCFVEVMGAGAKAVAARNEAMRDFTYLFETGRGEGDRELPDAVALSMVGGLSEVIYREITAGDAEQLPDILPELMYTAVLPIMGTEAAERELDRGRRKKAPSGS